MARNQKSVLLWQKTQKITMRSRKKYTVKRGLFEWLRVLNNDLKLHKKKGKALQPVRSAGLRCGKWPPLPLPSLHRVGGEASSLPAQSYTGLQRTCNQIKHTLHSGHNASTFHEVFLSSQTSLNPTTRATSVLMTCAVRFGWGAVC